MMKDNKLTINLFFVLMFVLICLTLYHTITNYGKNVDNDKIKIGFILDGDANDGGWNEANARGICAARDYIGFDLYMADKINNDPRRLYSTIKEMSLNGCKAIVLTSSNFEDMASEYSGEFSDITFLCNATSESELNFVKYSSRVYQARYLSGLIAGKMTKTNKIGYVAAIPTAEVNQGINAFTLGAQKSNANAVVNVMFTGSYIDKEKETEFAESLINDKGCDVLTVHENSNTVGDVADSNDVYYISYNISSHNTKELVNVRTDWENIYTDLIKEFMRGGITRDSDYWFGIDKDYVDIEILSDEIPEQTLKNIELERRLILRGYDVFTNMIKKNDGSVICRSGEAIPDSTLMDHMNWYVRGVNLINDQDY